MILTKFRVFGAWSCLVAVATLLPASTATAGPIPSRLIAAPELETARVSLYDALAIERLVGLGVAVQDAEILVAATRAAMVASLAQGMGDAAAGDPRTWWEGTEMMPREAALLAAHLSNDELAWLGSHTDEGMLYAGKVVGMNWKGLMLLALPLVGIAWVAAAGSGAAAGIAASGLIVGLVFVLFADPAFLFGSRDDVVM